MSLGVGIDYRVAASHAPGIGRYIRELTRACVERSTSNGEVDPLAITLVDVGRDRDRVAPGALGLGAPTENRVVARRRWALPRRAFVAAGRIGIAIDRLVPGLDVFHHARAPLLPIRNARQTIGIGDLPTDARARAELTSCVARCAAVFVFAEAARDPVARALGLARDRVVAVPVGANHWAREVEPTCSPSTRAIPRILVLGTQAARREPLVLLAALERLAGDGLAFDVLFAGRREGGDPAFFDAVARSPIASRLRFENPSEPEAPRIVAESAVLVHLDRDAITPVTPLEACASGCAVVTSESDIFAEALGDLVSTAVDERSLAEAIGHEIEGAMDEKRRGERRALAERFTWAACAAATEATWREVARAR